jgi:uncharacterized membrane protein
MKKTYLLSLVLFVAACGGEELGPPTGATCPTTSTLTYDSFGHDFMDKFCTGCHSSDLTGEDRHHAPTDDNFNTLDGVRTGAEEIDRVAAKGPDATNEIMPDPDAPDLLDNYVMPTAEERAQLGEWIACGTP